MAEIKKARILYSNMWIGFTEDKRNIAGAFKGICDGLSEADTLGYYRGDLAEIAAKLGLFLAEIAAKLGLFLEEGSYPGGHQQGRICEVNGH